MLPEITQAAEIHPFVQSPIVTTPVQMWSGVWLEPIAKDGYQAAWGNSSFAYLIATAVTIVLLTLFAGPWLPGSLGSLLLGLVLSLFTLRIVETVLGFVRSYIVDSYMYAMLCFIRVLKKYIFLQGPEDSW